ncbi:antibiotic biosynthesis monooxygenase [Thalassomonas viridans]|uniref:Antibiotic biosynthesis monooxygenase n=1 Tax=Thalassomonas viridans TaxID=137584 RepID=A0AAF0CDM1_9GAMM|nr:putative quinol monooxygenase [Thalassomonas viridans]WDE08715.1 antibiotic biosynthesis monooxygenase [Thalassomonas viridans]
MSGNSLFVFAKIHPKNEHFEEAKQAIINILKLTREEPGCRQFELHENATGKSLFLYEEWENELALEEHYKKPYTAAVFENYQAWLAAPVDITKMQKCTGA